MLKYYLKTQLKNKSDLALPFKRDTERDRERERETPPGPSSPEAQGGALSPEEEVYQTNFF